jgi:hypothetical protein
MRSAILLFAAALPACAAAEPVELPPRGQGSGVVCRSYGLDKFVGREAGPKLSAELLRASGAKTVRWVRPGSMITMDYRDDRLTVRVSESNRVIAANCG